MTIEKFVEDRVHEYYWKEDINCATTTLRILLEVFDIELNEQVMDSAIGMQKNTGDGSLVRPGLGRDI